MCQTFTELTDTFQFNAFALEKDSRISAADLNHPITSSDRITVSKDGHLQVNGKRMRIFGTNLSEFPKTHKDAEFAAQALAEQGFNCIRFHHTDADWTNCFIKRLDNGHRVLNTQRLDDFDYFFAQLKKNGIYSNINLLTGRTFNSQDGLSEEINQIQDWKNRHCAGFWNQQARQVQKNWAQQLLTHVNPYTGLSYQEDPAVAIVEINNENGLLQAYFCGNLEEYTGEYWQDLENQWNAYLKNKNLDYESLNKKYNTYSAASTVLVDKNSKWNMENHQGAKSTITSDGITHTIKVEKNGEAGWHIQYNCPKLNMQEDKIYTITFSAKASSPSEVDLSLMQAHSPWSNAGFSKRISLNNSWQDFTFAVSGVTTDNNLRLNFGNMGLSKGTTFYYKNIKIQEGGALINVKEGKNSTKSNKTVQMPHFSEYLSMPAELKALVTDFLWETESAYWKDMAGFIRNNLGEKALLMGTIIGCSTANIQADFDIIDSHAYWYHPSFPGKSWDVSNYFVTNKSLTKADTDNTLTGVARYRVYGKPFCCSEYDHPYPNQFQAEMYPMLASYASFQDWDALFTFCYTLPETPGGQSEKITGYFDQGLTPVKSCAAPVASRIFREFMVTPAKTAYYLNVSTQLEKEKLIKNSGWSIGETKLYGMNKTLGLTSRIGIMLTDHPEYKQPQGAQLITAEIAKNAGDKTAGAFSDTQELYWDENSGVYIVCNSKVTVTAICKDGILPEFPESWKQKGILQPLSNNQDFAVMAACKKNQSYIGFAASWNGNKGENLSQYGQKNTSSKILTTGDQINLTTDTSLGRGPAVVRGITGTTELFGTQALFAYAGLNGNYIKEPKTMSKIKFEPDCKSLWFIVEEK